jgi:hypothetical protein
MRVQEAILRSVGFADLVEDAGLAALLVQQSIMLAGQMQQAVAVHT